MDYTELSAREKRWAPHTYAWKCVKCVENPVYRLDGSIDPTGRLGQRWERQRRELERKELLARVGALGFKKRAREEYSRALDGRNQPKSAEVDLKDHLKKDTASD